MKHLFTPLIYLVLIFYVSVFMIGAVSVYVGADGVAVTQNFNAHAKPGQLKNNAQRVMVVTRQEKGS